MSPNFNGGGIVTDSSRIGLSSACFYPLSGLDAVKKCIDLGFKSIEIFANTFSELEEPHLRKVKAMCEDAGVRVVSIHPFTSGFEYMFFFSAYKTRAKDTAEYFYRKYFEAAAYLGAEYVVFHGDKANAPFYGLDNYCEVYSMVRDTAKRHGITLIHENVSTARGGDPEFMRQVHEKIGEGNIKFVFDLKQAVRGGYSPEKMLDAMGGDVVHVHINDWKDVACKLPFAGELDVEGIIARLERQGYAGKYIIEVYRNNFECDSEIITAAEALKKQQYEHINPV